MMVPLEEEYRMGNVGSSWPLPLESNAHFVPLNGPARSVSTPGDALCLLYRLFPVTAFGHHPRVFERKRAGRSSASVR